MGCGASTAQVPPRQLVLLGGGECGKTTIFKQIQLLHGSGFSDEVRSDWVSAVSASPLRSMRVLLTKADELGLPVNEAFKEAILGSYQSLNQLTEEAAGRIKEVYKSPEIQGLINDKEQKLDLDDNAFYFLDKVEEMGKSNFLPSTEDILKVRDPTRTIETLDFQYGKAKFRVIDVGGQRMERPKWNLTGEITAVIFVCALTEYNQVLREDIKQNRLKESLNLFDIACNRRYPDKPILLFLNKKDLFANKIKDTDLKVCFPTYKGGCDYDAALEYIKWKFMNVRKDKSKQIYVMETTATDTKNMEFIIKSMVDIVEKQNLAQSGFS
jgi:GTPase SAR1 family protein